MAVTFLAPTTALIAAAVVLPLLVAMYLLKLRRRPLRVSSILLWEKFGSDVQVNVPLARPRASWLLFLHVLIAGLLIAAVGRPVLPGVAGAAGRLIVVLDQSASMNARDGDRAGERVMRLEEAKERALRAVRQSAAASASIAVVTFAGSARVAREFSTDAALVERAIMDAGPTDQPGNLAAVSEVVRALLSSVPEGESGTAAGVEVLLFSDGVFADAGGDLPAAPMRLVRVGPTGGHENLGIVALAARRVESDMEAVELFVRVQNAAREPRVVPVSLALSGRVLETRTLTVPAAGVDGPGEASMTFACRPSGKELATVSLGVDAARDLLSADNAASLLLRGFRPPRAVWVNRGATASAGEQNESLSAGFLLRDVLEELRLGELRRVSLGEYEELVSTNQLRFFDAVIFEGVTPLASPTLPSLSIGAGLPECTLGTLTPGGPGKPVLTWTRSHPLLQFVILDGVVVSRSRAMREVRPPFAAIARGESGPLIVVRDTVDEPRRIVVTFDLSDSNWPLEPGFAIFLNAGLAWLTNTGTGDAAAGWSTTEPVLVEDAGARAFERVGRGADESPVRATPQTGRLSLGVLERAGVYVPADLAADAGAGPGRTPDPVAVNLLDGIESGIATSDSIVAGRRAVAGVTSTPAAMEVWWWFLLGALGLLVVEWMVFAKTARS